MKRIFIILLLFVAFFVPLPAEAIVSISGTSSTLQYSILKTDAIWQLGATGGNMYNCTVYEASFWADENMTLKNSIVVFSRNSDIIIEAAKTVSGQTNLFGDASKSGGGTYTDIGGTLWSTNPLFRNPTEFDYHLQPGSPAINKGTDVGLTSDYRGRKVPQNNIPDIGGYESQKSIVRFGERLWPIYSP
jgi:hypothetical protein